VICGSVAEAMVAGLPVVTMTPQTYTDLIEDGVNGFIVKTADEAIIVIRKLLENESLREKIAAKGAAVARHRFSIDRHVKDWNATLEEVAAVRASA
jgi:glycosyltransferase involved in cell wall biosynthesis